MMTDFETDHLGFLADATEWNEHWVKLKSTELNLEVDALDMDIIESLRAFYFDYDMSPAMRPLVKLIKHKFGADKGNSIWLMQRYGESPARVLALLSGLPKPKNCL